MTVGSLFTGIGGLDLGLERAGMHVRWQCEIDSYCQRVLRKHWPNVRLYDDIRIIDDATAERVDLICGGFPCQPVSLAGKGLAQKDPRWLWPEFARVVGLLRPRYVIVENVPGLRKRGLEDVIGDLAAMGYDAEWQIVSAASVGAPHLRQRYVIVAYSPSAERGSQELADVGAAPGAATELGERSSEVPGEGNVAHSDRLGRERGARIFSEENGWIESSHGSRDQLSEWWAVEPDVGRVAHGVPARLDRLRTLGNAVVPQVAEFVGRLIMDAA